MKIKAKTKIVIKQVFVFVFQKPKTEMIIKRIFVFFFKNQNQNQNL